MQIHLHNKKQVETLVLYMVQKAKDLHKTLQESLRKQPSDTLPNDAFILEIYPQTIPFIALQNVLYQTTTWELKPKAPDFLRKRLQHSIDEITTTLRLYPTSQLKIKEHALFEGFLKEYNQKQKQNDGTFYTPPPIIELMLQLAEQSLMEDFSTANRIQIIDPAMGTGLFFQHIQKRSYAPWINSEKIGIELRYTPYILVQSRYKNNELQLYNEDTLTFTATLLTKLPPSVRLVIGNPPYAKIQKKQKTLIPFAYAKNNFTPEGVLCGYHPDNKGYVPRNLRNREKLNDLYAEFFGSAMKLCGSHGIICLITPNSYLSIASYLYFRLYILQNYDIRYIINFNNISERNSVFQPEASISTAILVLSTHRKPNNKIHYLDLSQTTSIPQKFNAFLNATWSPTPKTWKDIQSYTLKELDELPFTKIPQKQLCNNLNYTMRIHPNDTLLCKIENQGIPIKTMMQTHQGVDTGDVQHLTASSKRALKDKIEDFVFKNKGENLSKTAKQYIQRNQKNKRIRNIYSLDKTFAFVFQKDLERWGIRKHHYTYMDHHILWRSRIGKNASKNEPIFQKEKLLILERRERKEMIALVTKQCFIPQHGGRFFLYHHIRKSKY